MRQVYKLLGFLFLVGVIIAGLTLRNTKQTGILNNTIETPDTKVRGQEKSNQNLKDKPSSKIENKIEIEEESFAIKAQDDLKNLSSEILNSKELVHNPAPAFQKAAFIIGSVMEKDKETQSKFFRNCQSDSKLNRTIRFICGQKIEELGL